MHLTAAQQKAMIVFLVFFQAVVVYHWLDNWLYPSTPADFTAFEKAFQQKADSLDSLARLGERADQAAPGERPAKAVQTGRVSIPSAASRLQEAAPLSININTASAEELCRLPRIGPKTAARIIAYRDANGPFKAKKELEKVRGIGPKTLEKLIPLITVE